MYIFFKMKLHLQVYVLDHKIFLKFAPLRTIDTLVKKVYF